MSDMQSHDRPLQKPGIGFFVAGFAGALGWTLAAAVLSCWAIQSLALIFGETVDGGAILWHLILSFVFLAFCPGQTLWVYQRTGPDGRVYVFAGERPGPDTED